MRSLPSLLLASLAWLVALLLLSCRSSHGPVTPLVEGRPHQRVPARADPTPPPISLTASDGTGLALVSLKARAVIEEPMALTELELEFQSPRGEVMEGRFEILLPPGARVTRFALHGDGGWQEAEVVGKQQARAAYETFLHEQRDPALLERDTGNRFRGRVFPLPPYGRKYVRVSFVQALVDPQQPYRLGLRGLPWLEALDLHVQVSDPAGGPPRVLTRSREREVPEADLVIPRDALPHDGVRQGEHVLARVQPLQGVDPGEGTPIRRLTVLVDTSASRALDFDASLLALGRLLQALARHAGTAHLQVLAFDQEVVPIYEGPLVGFGVAPLTALHTRRPLGASDLGRALQALEGGEHQRVLLVSDGLVSAGEHSDAALRRQLASLASAGVERLDALAQGSVRDEPRLRGLVSGLLPHAGVLLAADLPPEQAAERMRMPTFDGLRVEVPGARWWSPTRLHGMQPGDAVLVYAELPEHQPLRVQVSGAIHHETEVPLRPGRSPLVEHEWRQGQIEGLVTRMAALQDALESDRLRHHVLELSVRHRIVNDFTAFLVLEHEDDYARFGLDRRALAEILVVGPRGVEVVDRTIAAEAAEAAEPTEPDTPAPPARSGGVISDVEPTSAPPPPEPESQPEPDATTGQTVATEEFRNIPVGSSISRDFTAVVESSATATRSSAGISLAGTTGAESVYVIDGATMSTPAKPVPARVSVRGTRVTGGGLGPRWVRRAARRQLDAVERCYHRTLHRTSSRARGRVVVQLTTDGDGRVTTVGKREQVGLDEPELLQCVERALLAWELPAWNATITQTLVFLPNDGPPEGSWALDDDPTPTPDTSPNLLFETIQQALARNDRGQREWAFAQARAWRERAPVDVLALVALGDAARARGDLHQAARAYGSILDLYPSRADMRRFAAANLEATGSPEAIALAVDAYTRARAERPDHPSSHRNLAYALLRQGQPQQAFEALVQGLGQRYPPRFPGVARVLADDLGIVAAAWLRLEPTRASTIRERLAALGIAVATEPTLRATLTWETDANDVDLHIHAGHGHAFSQSPALASGGGLFADVNAGFGPEHIAVPVTADAFPYQVSVHYYDRGAMGYGMGKVQILHHDGEGRIRLQDVPFVALQDDVWLSLTRIEPGGLEGLPELQPAAPR